jgi:hypothetical protein
MTLASVVGWVILPERTWARTSPVSRGRYIAVRLGCDREYGEHVRRELAGRTDVLFEDGSAVSEHERFFAEACGGA